METKNIIVIGGGAAGFFAAINCAEKNKNYSVTILEKTNKLLSKVHVSGGGRCNVTHALFDNKQLIKQYPRGEKELLSVFSRFAPQDTIDWFAQRGVELITEPDGRMFPASNTSETIVNCLMQEAANAGVKIKYEVCIEEIIRDENDSFVLIASNGGNFHCHKLIIAAGGNSKDGAYNWIRKSGHLIINPVPSLFTFNIPKHPITQLMGVAVPDVKVRIANTRLETEGALMITHWGLSGPAVLKASAWGARILSDLNYNFKVQINWLPKHTGEKLKIEFANQREEHPSKTIIAHSPVELPKRLWEYSATAAGITDTMRWADLPKKSANILINCLINDEYTVHGKTTFKEEFVTCGGVNLKEIDLTTMQSKLIPNLYFAGEIIDVDGLTGGFNFQNAWSTAWIAAMNC